MSNPTTSGESDKWILMATDRTRQIKQLREQLDAERDEKEMFQRSQEAWIADYRKSQQQLTEAVEALKLIADEGEYASDMIRIAKAALAKVSDLNEK